MHFLLALGWHTVPLQVEEANTALRSSGIKCRHRSTQIPNHTLLNCSAVRALKHPDKNIKAESAAWHRSLRESAKSALKSLGTEIASARGLPLLMPNMRREPVLPETLPRSC